MVAGGRQRGRVTLSSVLRIYSVSVSVCYMQKVNLDEGLLMVMGKVLISSSR